MLLGSTIWCSFWTMIRLKYESRMNQWWFAYRIRIAMVIWLSVTHCNSDLALRYSLIAWWFWIRMFIRIWYCIVIWLSDMHCNGDLALGYSLQWWFSTINCMEFYKTYLQCYSDSYNFWWLSMEMFIIHTILISVIM